MNAQTTLNAAIAAGFDRLSTRDVLLCILEGASSGGGGGTDNQSGNGSPVGVATPAYVGQTYTDLTTPGFWTSTGLTSANWLQIA